MTSTACVELKDLRLNTQIGTYTPGATIPDHFGAVMKWSAEQNEDNIAWKGNLICNIAYNSDGIELSPNAGTTLYYTYVVHQELFIGLGF